MKDWNGEWWAEALEGRDLDAYLELIRELEVPHEKARRIFELGHDHGYVLASDMSADV